MLVESLAPELDDIQHFLISRPPALTARYEFLTFRKPAGGRAWLSGILDKVGAAKSVGSSAPDSRWVTVAFTWNGLRALGVNEASLATFPEEFRQGMAARSGILGTTGANHPEHWLGGLASPDLHAIVVLFARDVAERERCKVEHQEYLSECAGVEVLSSLDLEAIPPFTYAREHFGYRDRLSQPVIEGTGDRADSRLGSAYQSRRILSWLSRRKRSSTCIAATRVLSRNGSYLAYIRMQEHVGAFRDFLRQHGKTREDKNWLLPNSWDAGAAALLLILAPENDDPALGADIAAHQQLQLRKDGPLWLWLPCGLARSAHEPA